MLGRWITGEINRIIRAKLDRERRIIIINLANIIIVKIVKRGELKNIKGK